MTRKIKSIKNPEVLVNKVRGTLKQMSEYKGGAELTQMLESALEAAGIEYDEPIKFVQEWHENTGKPPEGDPERKVETFFRDGGTDIDKISEYEWDLDDNYPAGILFYTFDIFDGKVKS